MSASLHHRKGNFLVRKTVKEGEDDEQESRNRLPKITTVGESDAKYSRRRGGTDALRFSRVRCLSLIAASAIIVTFGVIIFLKTGYLDFTAVQNSPPRSALSRRFPEFGSAAFSEQCPWSAKPLPTEQNCTLFFRPSSRQGEGIAQWVTTVVQGFLQAQLLHCRLLVDYGEAIDLEQVLVAPSRKEERSICWSVPTGFICLAKNHCNKAPLSPRILGKMINQSSAVEVPYYRHVYKNITNLNIRRGQFHHLEDVLPDFQLEVGFACSWNRLFQLAPAAAQFETNLFTELLPMLRDPGALVLAVYVRTGFTDQAARAEKNGTVATTNRRQHENSARPSTTCALQLEQDFLQGRKGDFPFSRIVWMLVTDSVYVKRYVVDTYGHEEVHTEGGTVPRIVLVTGSHGKHSRPSRNPSTADFSESMIDWHLIGESDVVITNNEVYTFVTTAAMRTKRQIYNGAKGCSLMTWLHD